MDVSQVLSQLSYIPSPHLRLLNLVSFTYILNLGLGEYVATCNVAKTKSENPCGHGDTYLYSQHLESRGRQISVRLRSACPIYSSRSSGAI